MTNIRVFIGRSEYLNVAEKGGRSGALFFLPAMCDGFFAVMGNGKCGIQTDFREKIQKIVTFRAQKVRVFG